MTRRWLTALGLGLLLMVPASTQGAGNCTVYRVFVDGEVPTVDDWNNSFAQAATTNSTPACVDDHSASVGEMQTMTDPYPGKSESLPTSLAGELERIRYQIRALHGRTHWYEDPHKTPAPNLVANGSLEAWTNATGSPFGWTLTGAAATDVQNSTAGQVKHGSYSAEVARNGADAALSHGVTIPAGGTAYFRGRVYTAAAWARSTVADTTRISIYDGVGETFSSYHTGGGDYEYLTVTRTLSGGATELTVRLNVQTTNATSQFDAVSITEGFLTSLFTPSPESVLGGGVLPSARAYNTLNLSIADDGAWHDLTLNSERYDAGDIHSVSSNTNRFTAPIRGFYIMSCSIEWAASATGNRGVGVRESTGTILAAQWMPAGASISHLQTVTTMAWLTVGSWLECIAKQSSGGPLNVVATGEYSPEVSFAWLGP